MCLRIRENLSLILLATLVASTLTGLGVGPADSTTLSVTPQTNTGAVGDTFSIDIYVTDATNLWGYEVVLRYNTTILNATSSTPTADFPDISFNQRDDAQGWVWVAASLPTGEKFGLNGSRTLLTIGFSVDAIGESTLDIDEGYTILIDAAHGPITFTIVDGYFTNLSHDIAVANVTASPTKVTPDGLVSINVNVTNLGDFAETFNATVFYDSVLIERRTGVFLGVGASTTLTFTWNTTGVAVGIYTISAEALVEEDKDPTNNRGTVNVSIGGEGTLFVNPSSVVDETKVAGSTFTVTVDIDAGVTNLWGYEFKFWYNTAILTATLSTPSPDFPDVSMNKIDDSKGLVWVAANLPMGTTVGLNGPRTLVTIKFSVEAIGKSALNIDGSYTTLISAAGTEITPTIVDGYFDNVPTAHPSASFTYSPHKPLVNEMVTFDASLSTPNDETIVSYEWDFGDGTIVIYVKDVNLTATTTHAYATFGTYTVTLKVTNSENIKNALSKPIRVYALPVAKFTHSPTEPTAGGTVTLNASTSEDPDGVIESYAWNFGDGNLVNETDPITSHTYTNAGTYTVTLTVTDSEALTDTITQSITIGKSSSTISIDVSSSSIREGENITITGSINPTRKGVTVTIWYRSTGAQAWNNLTAVQTTENSQYSYTWAPPTTPETYEVKTSWAGDANTLGDESDIKTIQVQELGPPPVIPLYVVAGIATIIILAIILVYVLRTKKTKPT